DFVGRPGAGRVVHHDGGPVAAEAFRDGPPDAPARPGHEGDLTLQTHGLNLLEVVPPARAVAYRSRDATITVAGNKYAGKGDGHGEGQPRREVRPVHRAVAAQDRGRAERAAGQAGEVPGAVRLAPPRPRGRVVPGGPGPLPHGVPRPPRLAG